jgi:hypothetical protein
MSYINQKFHICIIFYECTLTHVARLYNTVKGHENHILKFICWLQVDSTLMCLFLLPGSAAVIWLLRECFL